MTGWIRSELSGPPSASQHSALTVVSRTPSRMNLWWIGANGAVEAADSYEIHGNLTPEWNRFELAPAGSASPNGGIIAVSRIPGSLEVWWIGADGSVQGAYWYETGQWQRYQLAPAGSASPDGGMTAVSRIPNSLEVWWIGANGSVEGAYWYEGGQWQRYQIALAGSAATSGGITAVSRIPNSLELWWTGPNGSVEAAYWYDGGQWQRYQLAPTGASLNGGITVVSRIPNSMEVWWIGANGSVQGAYFYDGGQWQRYELAPAGSAAASGGITSMSRIPGILEVWWVGEPASIQHALWRDGEQWQRGEFAATGNASLSSGLCALSRNPPGIEVFWIGGIASVGGLGSIQLAYWRDAVSSTDSNGRMVEISPGTKVTADDVAQFDFRHTTPEYHLGALNQAYWWLYGRWDGGCWQTGDHMAALARMYEASRDRRYLDQLREFCEVALQFRDDYHPGDIRQTGQELPVQPIDEFRGRVMPAWGGKSVNSAGYHSTSETTTGMYGYPIAKFARLVVEDPSLHSIFGNDAVRYANELLKTHLAFLPYFDFQQVGNFTEGYLRYPFGQRDKCTEQACQLEYQKAIDAAEAEGPVSEETREWYGRQRKNCNDNRAFAGRILAHNQYLLHAMILIELWRVIDSSFYKQSANRSPDAAGQQLLIPLLLSRQHRYFVNRLQTINVGPHTQLYFWHGGDDIPPGVGGFDPEDVHHGAVTVRYLEVLRSCLDRLNAYAAPAGEPIPMDDAQLARFANTFQYRISGSNFASDVTGADRDAKHNGDAGGWLSLAPSNPFVYQACHKVWTHTVDRVQPYLNITTHSWLLRTKQYGSKYRYYERSRLVGGQKAAGSPSAIVLPWSGEIRVVYRDTLGQLRELWQRGRDIGERNLTLLADNAIRATGDPKLYIDKAGTVVALYRGTDGHVHSIWSNGNQVGRDALSANSPGAPKCVGDPCGYVQTDGTNLVFYRTENKRLHALYWRGSEAPGNENITPSNAPNALGNPAAYVNTNDSANVVLYRDANSHIHAMYWIGAAAVYHEVVASSPKAAGDPVAYHTAWNETHQIYYRGVDKHIHEIWWQGQSAAANWDLTAASGAPAAASDPAAYYNAATNTKHVIFRSGDGRLYEIWWSLAGGTPAHLELTSPLIAPRTENNPFAFTIQGPKTNHVIYHGTDDEIHEIRWV